jgi:hypothetical protein
MTYQQLSGQLKESDAAMENHGLKSGPSTVSGSEKMRVGESMMVGEREMVRGSLKWGVQRKQ